MFCSKNTRRTLMPLSNKQTYSAQKMKLSVKDVFSECNQICSFLRIWLHLLKKFLMENFIFCAVKMDSSRNGKCFLQNENVHQNNSSNCSTSRLTKSYAPTETAPSGGLCQSFRLLI